MLNVENLRHCDLSTIDGRKLTAAEWEAVKQEAHRRAHVERAKVARALIQGLRSWWRTATRGAIADSGAPLSRARPGGAS